MKKNKKGFSLVELLIVISIIGVLAVIMAINFSKAQQSGRDQRRIEDLKAIQNAAEQYYMLSGSSNYPSNSSTPWQWPISNGQIVLQNFPADPKNSISDGYIYTSSFNSNGGSNYCICAKVENNKSGNSTQADCKGYINVGNCLSAPCYYCVNNQQ